MIDSGFIVMGISLLILWLLHLGDSRRINLLELKIKKLEKEKKSK